MQLQRTRQCKALRSPNFLPTNNLPMTGKAFVFGHVEATEMVRSSKNHLTHMYRSFCRSTNRGMPTSYQRMRLHFGRNNLILSVPFLQKESLKSSRLWQILRLRASFTGKYQQVIVLVYLMIECVNSTVVVQVIVLVYLMIECVNELMKACHTHSCWCPNLPQLIHRKPGKNSQFNIGGKLVSHCEKLVHCLPSAM